MLSAFKVRISQGRQYIVDLRAARPTGYRGLPVLAPGECGPDCRACLDACDAKAIAC